jgi:hypothetical protein
MRIRISALVMLVIATGCFSSCKKNHYRVNVSSIKTDIEIKRLEYDLFNIAPDGIVDSVPYLKQKYGIFLQLFSYVINTGKIDDPGFGDFLVRFCTDKQNTEVYSLTNKTFPDVDGVEKGLNQAFRHYLYYFPTKNVPAVYTCITGFNNSIITGDSVLGIGLDRYLGADCEYYPRLEIYTYLSARMTPDNIVPDCMYAWAASEWDFSFLKYPADNVLSEIIHLGKLKYFEKCMLPETSDELIFDFNADQMKFCRNNEDQMWEYLIENDLLFSTDQFIIRKLTGEAPFTSYFTNESPGKASVWIGFRIVESYMKKNNQTLEGLMTDTDVQGILEKARYNPQ